MSIKIGVNSRLNLADLLGMADGLGNKIEHWDLLALPAYVASGTESQHTVRGSDRLESISFRFYQTSTLDWALAWANRMDDFIEDLNPGMTLLIPSKAYVRSLLGKPR